MKENLNDISKPVKTGTLSKAFQWFLYAYLFSTSLSLCNVLSTPLLSPEQSIFLYRINLLPFALVLLGYGFFQVKKQLSDTAAHFVTSVSALLCMPLILLMFYTKTPSLFFTSSMLLTFALGFLGAYFHLQLTRDFPGEQHIGLRYAITVSAAVLLQYLMQNVIKDHAFIAYTLLISCFLIALFSFARAKEEKREETMPDMGEASLNGNKLLKAVLSVVCITILLEFIGNFMTTSLLEQVASDNPITYDFPRLFIIFAYMAAGICTDIKKGKYLPVFTLCIIFITILNPILFHDGRDYVMNTCLYYIMAGSVNTYLTLAFVKLAAGKKKAPVICSLGRVVDSVFTCLFVTSILYQLSLEAVILIELAAIILIMLILAFSGQLSFTETEKKEPVARISPEAFAKHFDFTPKETEIFLAAIKHSGTTSELARSLFLSRSVLYRHFNRISEKTGCENFKGVLNLFYEMPADMIPDTEETNGSAPEKENAALQVDEISYTQKKEASDESSNNEAILPLTDVLTDESNVPQNKEESAENKLQRFSDRYELNPNEASTLQLFLSHPEMTQQQLAEQRGVTLRTMQRHLASIRQKTGCVTLTELAARYAKF
ncbi:MAG: hypothetical protein K6E18_04095 [Lachnospiraceae bacterium]|nr:hypothetical protein [Lachnospiraceae bacterium]